jgi:hypothetical protein
VAQLLSWLKRGVLVVVELVGANGQLHLMLAVAVAVELILTVYLKRLMLALQKP